MTIQSRLKNLGIHLPTPGKAVANYVPYVITGNLVIISGQLPLEDGKVMFKGMVGKDQTLEQAQAAARLCAINILTHLNMACDGDLSRVKRCLRLGGFVACDATYIDQPKVINGASDLMVAVFEENGRHARAAVGVSSLPLGASVEVEAIFELKN